MVKALLLLTMFAFPGNIIWAERPRFSDQQIIAMTSHYFKRSRGAPEFLAVNIYRHPQRGKVLQVDVRAGRNQVNEALSYSFTTLLNLLRYFKRPPELIVVVMHSDSHGIPPTIYTGEIKCAANYFIYRRIPYKEWYNKCVTREGP